MNQVTRAACVLAIALTVVVADSDPPKKVIHVEVGGHCDLGAAPVGPGGSWQVVETNVEKVCAKGSSCRKGACNCDDLADGTVMSLSVDEKGDRVCRRIAGQKCSVDTECFRDAHCVQATCVCDKVDDQFCHDSKHDVSIQA